MPMTLVTRTSLIAIPRLVWESEALEEIAGIALAMERRKNNKVLLPREGGRYPLVCARLSELARSLAEKSKAVVVWEADAEETALWISFTRQVLQWAQKNACEPRLRNGVWRLRSTFVPPDWVGDVLFALDELMGKHLSSWEGGDKLRPIVKRRLKACRSAGNSGIVESLSIYPIGLPQEKHLPPNCELIFTHKSKR